MTIRFSGATIYRTAEEDADDQSSVISSRSGSDYAEEDNNFEDWVSDQAQNQACRSLFEDKTFPSATATLSYDKAIHNFDLSSTCAALSSCSLVMMHIASIADNRTQSWTFTSVYASSTISEKMYDLH
jgi:protein arginine N-methyltransferase 3